MSYSPTFLHTPWQLQKYPQGVHIPLVGNQCCNLKHPPNYICHLLVKNPPLCCLQIAVDLSNHRQKNAAFELTLSILGPYRILSLSLWFSSLHLAWLHTTHHVKDWNTHTESFKEDSQGRNSTWCSPVVKIRIEPTGYIVCSLGLVLSEPIKNSLERHQGCVYGVGVLCMFLCVCVETGGPSYWCWGAWLETQWDFSHSCLMRLCPQRWSVFSMWQFKGSRCGCMYVSFHVHYEHLFALYIFMCAESVSWNKKTI